MADQVFKHGRVTGTLCANGRLLIDVRPQEMPERGVSAIAETNDDPRLVRAAFQTALELATEQLPHSLDIVQAQIIWAMVVDKNKNG